MSNDRFFDRVRHEARRLRYEPEDAALWTRLAARIRERIQLQPSVSQLLAGWFRPIAASLTALAVASALSLALFERSRDNNSAETMTSSSVEVSVGGDTFSVAD
jgi:hypothetical protein